MLKYFSRNWFLFKYYVENFLCVRVAHRLAPINILKIEAEWISITQKFSDKSTIVIVANGPSLKASDLELLSRYPSIASNKINLIYDQTFWRADLHTICDPLLIYKLQTQDFSNVGLLMHSDSSRFLMRGIKIPKIYWLQRKRLSLKEFEVLDFKSPVRATHTITAINIQLGIKMGFKRILVIGLDHSYDERKFEKVKKLSHEGNNHFIANYRKEGEIVNNAPIKKMEADYEFCADIARKFDVEIVNVSRNTHLSTFKCGVLEDFV